MDRQGIPKAISLYRPYIEKTSLGRKKRKNWPKILIRDHNRQLGVVLVGWYFDLI